MNRAASAVKTNRFSLFRWIFIVPILASVAMAAILFANHRPPLFTDYAEWTYHGVLLRDWLQGHPDSAYLLKTYPVPNSLTTIGLGVLMLVMPWKIAAKLWLVIEVTVGLLCANRLQRASNSQQGWQLMIVTAGALVGVNLWYGFTNFQFSTYFAMLFCALLIEDIQSQWIYGALLVLLFFSHMIPFGLALCALCLYAWQHGRWQILWQSLPSLLLSVWYFVGRSIHGNVDGKAGMHSSVPYASSLFAAFRINTFLKCWGFVNAASTVHDSVLLKLTGTSLFLFFFALDAVIGISVLVLAGIAARRSISRHDSLRFFWLTIGLFFLVGLIMPEVAAGVSDPGGRMVQVSLWCAVCVLTTRSRWVRRMLSCCAVGLMALSLYEMAVVAERPPTKGIVSALPMRLREFGHVIYTVHSVDYDQLSDNKMDANIYPTAMFVKKPRQ
jgi:hypothetical protein